MKKVIDDEILDELRRVLSICTETLPKQDEWKQYSNFSVDVLIRSFGSYSGAWSAIGVEYKQQSVSAKKDEIITALKKSFIEDKCSNVDDIVRKSGHARSTITKYFGSVYDAFIVAKIDIGIHISVDDLKAEFLNVCNKLGKVPTDIELSSFSKYPLHQYKNKLGTIEEIAQLLNIKTENKFKETDEELLSELKLVCENLGRAPTIQELCKLCKFSNNVYTRRFGSYGKALEQIGYNINKNVKVKSCCPICGIVTHSIISHYTTAHKKELDEIELDVVKDFKNGLSNREIANSGKFDFIFKGSTTINRVVSKYLNRDEKEELRRQKIQNKLKEDYANGKYEWVSDLNRARNTTGEARQKNSDGLKKAYANGTKESWNKGLTKDICEQIKTNSLSTSKTMKHGFSTGVIERKIGPESNTWNENREEVCGRYRLGLNFNTDERENIKKRAEYKCEMCQIDQQTLKEIGQVLECDHIIPIYKGGLKDWIMNGQALCPECHKQKTRRDLKPDDGYVIAEQINQDDNQCNIEQSLTKEVS